MPHPGQQCLADFGLFFEGLAEPCSRVLPVAIGDGPRDAHRLARLLDREPAEQVKVRDPARSRVFLAKSGQQLVQRQDQIGVLGK
jgi:hypothetical protein